MTSPARAIDTDNGRYYNSPPASKATGPLVSVTNVLSNGFAKPALVPWAAKIAAEYAVDNLPGLVAQARTTDRETLRKSISGQVTVARDKAADLGTRVHALAEAKITGHALPDDPEAQPYVEQYIAFLTKWSVDVETDVYAAEMTVAHPQHGYAGTGDLWINLPLDGFIDGKCRLTENGEKRLWLVDFKSSATRPKASIYPEYVAQLAALRACTEAWLPDDTVVHTPAVAGCAVLNLRTKDHALIPVDAGTPAFKAFLGALDTTKWLHARTGSEPVFEPTGPVIPRKRAPRKTTTTTPKAA